MSSFLIILRDTYCRDWNFILNCEIVWYLFFFFFIYWQLGLTCLDDSWIWHVLMTFSDLMMTLFSIFRGNSFQWTGHIFLSLISNFMYVGILTEWSILKDLTICSILSLHTSSVCSLFQLFYDMIKTSFMWNGGELPIMFYDKKWYKSVWLVLWHNWDMSDLLYVMWLRLVLWHDENEHQTCFMTQMRLMIC